MIAAVLIIVGGAALVFAIGFGGAVWSQLRQKRRFDE